MARRKRRGVMRGFGGAVARDAAGDGLLRLKSSHAVSPGSGGQPGLSVSYHGMESPMSFDTLRAVATLEDVGFQARQAKAIVATMNQAFGEQMATKADIVELRTATKADIAGLKASTEADIAALKASTKTDVAGLKTDIAELKAILTWRIVLAMGAFAALVRFLP